MSTLQKYTFDLQILNDLDVTRSQSWKIGPTQFTGLQTVFLVGLTEIYVFPRSTYTWKTFLEKKIQILVFKITLYEKKLYKKVISKTS